MGPHVSHNLHPKRPYVTVPSDVATRVIMQSSCLPLQLLLEPEHRAAQFGSLSATRCGNAALPSQTPPRWCSCALPKLASAPLGREYAAKRDHQGYYSCHHLCNASGHCQMAVPDSRRARSSNLGSSLASGHLFGRPRRCVGCAPIPAASSCLYTTSGRFYQSCAQTSSQNRRSKT